MQQQLALRKAGPVRSEIQSSAVARSVRDELLAAIPDLRAFAYSLTMNRDRADDLVQETILRAWASIERFERGSNTKAWLFTILRNVLYSEHRKRKREVADDGSYAARLTAQPDQQARLDFEDFQRALQKLPLPQREALLLIGAEDLSYEEAADICGVALGTLKSRVSRARERLALLLELTGTEDIGPDQVTRAAMQPH
jgi:RNA polymerase sigma-70 factor (ECF subfamily)